MTDDEIVDYHYDQQRSAVIRYAIESRVLSNLEIAIEAAELTPPRLHISREKLEYAADSLARTITTVRRSIELRKAP